LRIGFRSWIGELFKGLLIPVDLDHNGNIISVAIATDDEEEYYIDTNQNVTNLISLLRQEVEVTGIISHTGEKKVIRVESCNRRRKSAM
jgi:hypothetical protein